MSMEELLREHRLSIKAKFVPMSRFAELNGGEAGARGWPVGDKSNPTLSFKVELRQRGQTFAEVAWNCGCFYTVAYQGRVTQAVLDECENGTTFRPTAEQVFSCVAQDSREVLLNRGFKEWAESLCQDADSIAAKHSYDQSVRTMIALVATIGYEAMMKLADDEEGNDG